MVLIQHLQQSHQLAAAVARLRLQPILLVELADLAAAAHHMEHQPPVGRGLLTKDFLVGAG
jgi:hypothetical protein